jgi:hypothetical protein
MNTKPVRHSVVVVMLACTALATVALTRERDERKLPKQVRGYKVERAQVELKKPKNAKDGPAIEEELLVRLGEAELVSVSPLGVTFEVPVVLSPVKQKGKIDQLVFDEMRVNDMPVTIEDYVHPFELPNKEPLIMNPPLRIFVSTPRAVLQTVDEVLNSKKVWPVTGRVYVCGHFKRFLFSFKRAVPVELQTIINNPLH